MKIQFDPVTPEAEAIRQRYLKVDAATVADALDALGYQHQGLAPTFAPYPSDAGKLAGWAYTILGEMRPYAGTGDPEKMKAVDGIKLGCVTVWSGAGDGVCFFGELIALGILNALLIAGPVIAGIGDWEAHKALPTRVRWAAASSLAIWLAVAACGRLIAYF